MYGWMKRYGCIKLNKAVVGETKLKWQATSKLMSVVWKLEKREKKISKKNQL